MATHSVAAQNTATDAITALVDAGAGAGNVVIKNSGGSEVATNAMSDPAFGASSGGVATANAITTNTNITGGIADNGVIQDSNTLEPIAFTISAVGGGGEVEFTTLTFPAGGTLAYSSLTYQALIA